MKRPFIEVPIYLNLKLVLVEKKNGPSSAVFLSTLWGTMRHKHNEESCWLSLKIKPIKTCHEKISFSVSRCIMGKRLKYMACICLEMNSCIRTMVFAWCKKLIMYQLCSLLVCPLSKFWPSFNNKWLLVCCWCHVPICYFWVGCEFLVFCS